MTNQIIFLVPTWLALTMIGSAAAHVIGNGSAGKASGRGGEVAGCSMLILASVGSVVRDGAGSY